MSDDKKIPQNDDVESGDKPTKQKQKKHTSTEFIVSLVAIAILIIALIMSVILATPEYKKAGNKDLALSIVEIEKKLAKMMDEQDEGAFELNEGGQYKPSQQLIDNLSNLGVTFDSLIDLSPDQQIAGLVGIKVRLEDNQVMPLFMTVDGKYFIPAIIDMETRVDIAQEIGLNMMAGGDASDGKLSISEDWDRLAETHFITMGSDDPSRIVYITHDPYCPHCNRLWLDKEKLGGIPESTQIRIIPVGLQGDHSTKVIAYWFDLQANDGDPVASINEHETLRGKGQTMGIHPGIDFSKLSEDSMAKASFNKKHLMAFGITGTPYIIYKDLVSDEANMLPGRPRDLSTLKEILEGD